MRIVFYRIPRMAKIFYLIGFIIIAVALLIYFQFPQLIANVLVQQGFILGAIIVALGSVINTLYQFKRSDKEKHQRDTE